MLSLSVGMFCSCLYPVNDQIEAVSMSCRWHYSEDMCIQIHLFATLTTSLPNLNDNPEHYISQEMVYKRTTDHLTNTHAFLLHFLNKLSPTAFHFPPKTCLHQHTLTMSPTNLFPTKSRSIHVYTDFDSTVTLRDTGDAILAHEMGQQELVRIDRLPETDPQNFSLRKAEDLKWDHVRLSIKEAVDILIGPGPHATQGQIEAYEQAEKRKPFDEEERSYRVEIDPGFESLYRLCKEHDIPITVVSM